MKASNNNVFLVLTAAVVIAGEIAKKGEVVELTKLEARDLLHRKKARIATAEDGVEVDADGQEPEQGQDETKGDQDAEVTPAAKSRKPAAQK